MEGSQCGWKEWVREHFARNEVILISYLKESAATDLESLEHFSILL
jgi:hypothetical protein